MHKISRTPLRSISFPKTSFYLLCIAVLLFAQMPAHAAEDDSSFATGQIDGTIFEERVKWFNAYLSLSNAYDDNIFNTADNKKSDYIREISPGIQLMAPEADQTDEEIDINPTVHGGLVFNRFERAVFQRFKIALGYAPRFLFYNTHTDENTVNQNVRGTLQYNLRSGISCTINHRYTEAFNQREANASAETGRYKNNLIDMTVSYPISEKFRSRIDYSNFQLNYDTSDIYGYRDRTDNAGAGYIFYRFAPKTSAFIEYRYVDIDYNENPNRNGDSQNFSVGLRWNVTAKTDGSVQFGYAFRQYATPVYADSRRFIFQGRMNYYVSPKTRLNISGYRRNAEASESDYNYFITTNGALTYSLQLALKLELQLHFAYTDYDYRGGSAAIYQRGDRNDDRYVFAPSLKYNIGDWLVVSGAYEYRKIDSTIHYASYAGNTVVFKIAGAI